MKMKKNTWKVLGLLLGTYNRIEVEFVDCLVSDEAMRKLDEHCGVFFW